MKRRCPDSPLFLLHRTVRCSCARAHPHTLGRQVLCSGSSSAQKVRTSLRNQHKDTRRPALLPLQNTTVLGYSISQSHLLSSTTNQPGVRHIFASSSSGSPPDRARCRHDRPQCRATARSCPTTVARDRAGQPFIWEDCEIAGLMRQGFSQPAAPGEWDNGPCFQQQP